MKAVLTIDFDIIMEPSIMIYNDLVPENNIEDLKRKSSLYDCCKINASHYVQLTRLLIFLIKKIDKTNIHFIHRHDSIVKYINEPTLIFNIDHHHDLGYGPDDNELRLKGFGCANWVRWIFEKNLLNNYIWINNYNSDNPIYKLENIKILQLKDINNLEVLFANDIDEIFICLSDPWIPKEYYDLFFLWMDLCNL